MEQVHAIATMDMMATLTAKKEDVDANVNLIMTVPKILHASNTNASTLVLELVEVTQFVKLLDIFLVVHVLVDT